MPEVTNTEIGPDDTLDGDYGRLLERAIDAYVKRHTPYPLEPPA